ncbi:hypothetical protein RMN57_15435 [Kitasatospora sp. CM 4170]|uniref:Secreted protein n=1 Tax=Kitasatospora aburaviensis TaxID=67265 RepID=A0ABW1ES67_9ACTN|nr:hypothetical protein [Kitasatospora sp. CM 4170]WNM46000.1 hypothetical protein RMN57_15435 [Kitasatospora sp. CM 4170]
MRNGLVQLGAWAAATGAAVALSWFGVHTVLIGAAFERPSALPLPSASGGARTAPDQDPTAAAPTPPRSPAQTQAAPPSDSPAPPSATAPATAPRASAPSGAQPSSRRPAPAATTTSSVHSYPVQGGRVALDLRPDGASLVSAVPDPGWQMQIWNEPQWLRVDFTKDGQANSVFATWNGHPPTVETVVR